MTTLRPRRVTQSERARKGKGRKGEIGVYKLKSKKESKMEEVDLDPVINFFDSLIFDYPECKNNRPQLSTEIREANINNRGEVLRWINISKDMSKGDYVTILQAYENNQEMIANFFTYEWANANKESKERASLCLNQLEAWFCSIEEPQAKDDEWRQREIERCSGVSYHCRPALRERITPVVTSEMKATLKRLLHG